MAKTSAERVRALREKRKLAGVALETRAASLQGEAVSRGGVREAPVTRAEFEVERALRKAQEQRLAAIEDELAVWGKRFGAPGRVPQPAPLEPNPNLITVLREQTERILAQHAARQVAVPTLPILVGYNPLLAEPLDPTDFTPA